LSLGLLPRILCSIKQLASLIHATRDSMSNSILNSMSLSEPILYRCTTSLGLGFDYFAELYTCMGPYMSLNVCLIEM
jgi:hypothetical protein